MLCVPKPSRRLLILEPFLGLFLVVLPRLTPDERQRLHHLALQRSNDAFSRALRKYIARTGYRLYPVYVDVVLAVFFQFEPGTMMFGKLFTLAGESKRSVAVPSPSFPLELLPQATAIIANPYS